MILLYIDPGTGSMLFTILVGVLGAAAYFLRNVWVKLRFLFTGGAKEKQAADRVPYCIFTDSKRYWNTFEPICDEFERREIPLEYLTASPDDPALQKPYQFVHCRFIGEGNRAYAHMNFLKADVVLSSTPGLDVYQWKRSKDVGRYLHVLHAANDVVAYRMFGIDYYDTVLLSGAYQEDQIRFLEQQRHLPAKTLKLAGLPYLDAMQKRLESAPALPEHPTTLLLAPSWGKSSLFGRFEGKILQAALDTGYHVIVRPHPQSFSAEKDMLEKLMQEFPESEQLEWNRDNDNFEVLRRSDVMISDFSGVIFDFCLVFQKPVIYAETSYDKAPYDACWLEEEMWTFRTLPKIGKALPAENLPQLKSLVDELLSENRYRENLSAARDETWTCRGEAAARVADAMIEEREEYLEKKKAESSSDALKKSGGKSNRTEKQDGKTTSEKIESGKQ